MGAELGDTGLTGPGLIDLDVLAACAECKREVNASLSRGFNWGTEGALCFECAIRRGGVYEESTDRWLIPPDLFGLVSVWEDQ